jgi:HAD superfamily hydrolase (TIGR01459 family)
MAKTKFCSGVSEISDSYMGFIMDGHGVLHDGEDAFPGTIDALKELKERKKSVLILMNAAGRAETHRDQLRTMGITPSLYTAIVTPAQVIFDGVKSQAQDVFEKIGKRVFIFGKPSDAAWVEGTGAEIVDDIEDAEFVVIAGMDYPRKTLQDYEPIILKSIQRRLKAICPYPDAISMMTGGLNVLMGPTLIARRYQDAGGIVNYIGKPYPIIFKYCFEILRKRDIYPAQTVMLGDTMAHDIIGAHGMGMDTCLFKSGLHAPNFAHCENLYDVNTTIKNLTAVHNNVMPTYLIDEFRWGMYPNVCCTQTPNMAHHQADGG